VKLFVILALRAVSMPLKTPVKVTVLEAWDALSVRVKTRP
jgi:hypothetical protein